MALLHVNFHSDVLGQAVEMNVILPQNARTQIGMASGGSDCCKVLYLLHGMSDDYSIWERRTSIERYVAGRNMAVIMPSAHLSWYTDMAHGGRYQTFIESELPDICHSFFGQLSTRREDNFIAGLSMGGYGALKIAFSNPDRFGGCAGLSSALDVYRRAKEGSDYWKTIFGSAEEIPGSKNDVYHLMQAAIDSGKPLPRVYLWCGTEDPLFPESLRAKEILEAGGCELSWNRSSGDHSWFYWDREIEKAINFFLKSKG